MTTEMVCHFCEVPSLESPCRKCRPLRDILDERCRQDVKFPNQADLPDGTGGYGAMSIASLARTKCDEATKSKTVTWKDVLREEYAEAMAETEPAKLRAELIQTAAVCIKWIEAIDRRKA